MRGWQASTLMAYLTVTGSPLSAEAKAAGILEDATVKLGKTSKTDSRPDHPIRLITIKTTPHVKCGKYKGVRTPEPYLALGVF